MGKISIQTKLTQLEIANAMGVKQPQVSNWLNGKRLPTATNLIKLADILQLYPEELLQYLSEIQKQKAIKVLEDILMNKNSDDKTDNICSA